MTESKKDRITTRLLRGGLRLLRGSSRRLGGGLTLLRRGGGLTLARSLGLGRGPEGLWDLRLTTLQRRGREPP